MALILLISQALTDSPDIPACAVVQGHRQGNDRLQTRLAWKIWLRCIEEPKDFDMTKTALQLLC